MIRSASIARLFIAGLAYSLVLSAGTLRAQTPPELTPEQNRTAVSAMTQLRSPYTPSHTVDMCPSAGALRDSIRVAAASGMTTRQIVEDVIGRHGEQLRVLPKRTGPGLWAWLLPPLVLLAGAALIAYRLRGARGAAPAQAGGSGLSDAERSELVAALHDWERKGGADA